MSDPQRFGVATLQGEKVTHIEEKPSAPATNFAVTGLYLYDSSVFEKINTLTPSDRGEYEISDINQMYIESSEMKATILQNSWTDAGTHESLFNASALAREMFLHA